MKINKYLYFIAICAFVIISSKAKAQDSIVNIRAKVTKIDSTKSFYIFNISYNRNKATFFVTKTCGDSINSIKLRKNVVYNFNFRRRFYSFQNGHLPTVNTVVKYADDKIVWTSKMKKIFYEECLNMCGMYIKQ